MSSRQMTDEERKRLDEVLEKERLRYEASVKAGGVVDGYYVRLHDRRV